MSAGIQITLLLVVSLGFVVFLVMVVMFAERFSLKAQMEQQQLPETPKFTAEQYEAIFSAIETGEIYTFDDDKLRECGHVVSIDLVQRGVRHNPTAVALLIQNIQIERLGTRVRRTRRVFQFWIGALAALAVIGACLQIWILING